MSERVWVCDLCREEFIPLAGEMPEPGDMPDARVLLARIRAEGAAEEREACAQIAWDEEATSVLDRIRARGTKETP